jgi:hypothetical protein
MLCKKDFVIHFKALKGRQRIAQGKAAQQPQSWVTIQNNPSFLSFAPGGGE